MGRAALKSKTQVVYQTATGPTLERLARARGEFELTGTDRASQRYTMQDSPLLRLWKRSVVSGAEYAALQRYYLHWYSGGLLSSCGSMDLNRIFAADPLSMSGMAKTERQAHHRQEYRHARQILGHRAGIVVDNVVCAEQPLEVAGYSIGYSSPYRARQAAIEMLRDAGFRLAKFWGVG